MESVKTPLKVNYVVYTRLTKIEQRFTKTYVRGFGEAAAFIESDLGWFLHFEGSYEALHFGMDQPHFKRGDKIKITFERIDDAEPCKPSVE